MVKDIENVSGEVELEGRRFPFYLERQELELGPTTTVQYYYMPASGLRHNRARKGVNNVRACFDHFEWLMELNGDRDDWNQQRDLVLAKSYVLVCRDKAVQNIYRDAFLKPSGFNPEKLELSDDIRQRVDEAVRQRNTTAIRHEMERALEAIILSPEDVAASSRAMDEWLNAGTDQFRQHGDDGLQRWMDEVAVWYHRYRKRSSRSVQIFLRVFAYEAKVSFYHKYAQFWISLLRWLENNVGLDVISKRFLLLWHNQNQRIEIPHGRTASGIVYPTSAVARLRVPDGVTSYQELKVAWMTPYVGPEVIPDVFLGQVLALHPLSWILLGRADLREAVGRCFASAQFDAALQSGHVADFDEYWEMVRAIVLAAYLYQIAHELTESKRNSRRTGNDSNSIHSVPPQRTEIDVLREFVETRVCECGGMLQYSKTDLPAPDGDQLVVPAVCRKCNRAQSLVTCQRDLEHFFKLLPPSDEGGQL